MFAEFAGIIRKNIFDGLQTYCGIRAKYNNGAFVLDPPGEGELVDRTLPRRLLLTILFWLVLPIYLYAFVGIYIDDTYITLSYVKTLVESGVWGMHAQLSSNSATSPLNVFLVVALTKISGDPVISVYVLTIGAAVVIFLCLRYFSRLIFDDNLFAYGATALLFSNPLLISTLGLESYLAIALMLAACVTFHREKFGFLGLFVGLLILARPDGLIVASVFAVLLVRSRLPVFLAYAGMVLITIAPWHLYAWYYLGSFVPDTLFIKLTQLSWGGFDYHNGLALYLKRFPPETIASFSLCLVLVPLLYVVRRNKAATSLSVCLLAAAILHFMAYSAMRVPPYHWYYSWIAASGAILGSLVLMLWCANRLFSLTLVTAVTVAGAALSLNAAVQSREMPIHTNWGTTAQYRDIAAWINENYREERFDLSGELGVVQYYTNANAINRFSDRLWLAGYLQVLDRRNLLDRMIAVNFRHASIPIREKSGYILTIDCDGHDGILGKWDVHTRWRIKATYCFREAAH